MKQHITPEQLNELSEKGKERLKEWWIKDERSDMFEATIVVAHPEYNTPISLSDMADRVGWYTDKGCYPLLSSGQMIEFLDEHSKSGHDYWIDKINDWNYDAEIYWIENAPKRLELCDALWEAVKEVLNRP